MSRWFEADKAGLRQIAERLVERRGFGILGAELYQNVMDTSATVCTITLEKTKSRGCYALTSEDNDPVGFTDLSHAYTVFAPSLKKHDPTKAGRFNLGEKIVLAFCREARIETTRGTVAFNGKGREEQPRRRRDGGTKFWALIECTPERCEEFAANMRRILVKPGLTLIVNGVLVPVQRPIAVIEETLLTEHGDELRSTKRRCSVEIYQPQDGQAAMLYELGIPVVETGDKWHYSVGQKVPLNAERDNVPAAYLRDLRAFVFNQMHEHVTSEDTEEAWISDATSDDKVTDAALADFKMKKFGANAVFEDPFNRDANAAALTMKRINHNTSGPIDLVVGGETIDLIEGLFFSRQEEPLIFEEKFRDTFFAAKPDVRDETVARFSANRFRQTYRSLRPMCEDNPETSDESLLPDLSRDVLDSKAIHFCRWLIERWVRDPSNMRLLRVALDVCPDPKAINVVLDVLKQYMDADSKRKAPLKRVAWYCAAELLKAGATETGLVTDDDCLPAEIDLRRYQEILADFAEQITSKRNTYPWYLEQQAHLFVACFGRPLDPRSRPSTSAYIKDYLRLRQTLAGRPDELRSEEVVPFVLLQKHLQDALSAARTFLFCFREKTTPVQRQFLRRVIQEDAGLAETIHNEMASDEQQAWRSLFHAHGIMFGGGFPETHDALPSTETMFAFLSVARSANNPFQQEYAALHFALALLKRLPEKLGLLFPSRIKIHAKDWRALCSDRFPIDKDAIAVEFDDATEGDVRFTIPEWVNKRRDGWKYQLGQILRVVLTGIPDYSVSYRRPPQHRSHVLYVPISSSWMRRRYGLFNGRNAFGPSWLPISSWLGSLLSRLLEWPGFARSDFDFELPDDFDMPLLAQLISHRIRELEGFYGRASRTAVLPVVCPKRFMRPKPSDGPEGAVSLRTMRVGVVQTVIPRMGEFVGDPEQNAQATRRRHRRHLSAVLGGVHRMLQVRETHRENGSGIELLVLPELSVHPDDVRSHLLPFVNQHRCVIFAGVVFHPAAGRPLVNSGYWIIPITRPLGGLQIQVIEQGKRNLTAGEQALGVSPFRPAQWMLRLLNPANQNLLWSMSGSICYDSTDLRLAADLRDLTDMYVVPAMNQDVGTFDNMAAALHYHMFQHVIVANTGQFGGSTGQAPFADRHDRMIFHTHGNEQVAVSFFEVDLDTYRNGLDGLKTPPAGQTRVT